MFIKSSNLLIIHVDCFSSMAFMNIAYNKHEINGELASLMPQRIHTDFVHEFPINQLQTSSKFIASCLPEGDKCCLPVGDKGCLPEGLFTVAFLQELYALSLFGDSREIFFHALSQLSVTQIPFQKTSIVIIFEHLEMTSSLRRTTETNLSSFSTFVLFL